MLRIGVVAVGRRAPALLLHRADSSLAATQQQDLAGVRPFKDIPGPKPLPFIGNIWRFLPWIGEYANMDLCEMEYTFHKKFGKIAKLSGLPGKKTIVFLYEPSDVEKAFRNEGIWPIREGFKTVNYYRHVLRKETFEDAEGVLFTQGKQWQDFRSKVNQPMMQPRSAKLYMESVDQVAADFIDRLRSLADKDGFLPGDLLNHLNRWALESIATIALDTRLGCLDPGLSPDSEPQQLIQAVDVIFDTAFELDIRPHFRHFSKHPLWKKLVTSLDCFTDVSMKHIQQAMTRIQNKAADNDREHSILERLLLNNDNPMVACVMALDMMFGGIDTTSNASAIALHHLAKNPDKLEKLFKELNQILPTKDHQITAKDLEDMKYLKACIKESMRLTPVVPSNLREVTKDLVLGNYQVPKGTDLVLCHIVMSSLEEHFSQADHFIPERWLKGAEEQQKAHPFVFLPFGFGPRMCIGRRFAELEIETLLAKIIRNFHLEIDHELKMESRGINKVVSPLPFRLQDRA